MKSNPKNSSRISSKQIVDELFKSSVDFFESSIKEVEKRLKFSIVHFAAALELALKTKLAAEHWTLLLDNPDKFKYEKFISGDFISVSASKIIERINSLCSHEIDKDELAAYNKIFFHRNIIMHYFHHDFDDESKKNEIVMCELNAWYYISKRLYLWAQSHLKTHSSRILTLNRSMSLLNNYTDVAFDKVNDFISEQEKNGKKVTTCNICNRKSVIELREDYRGNIFRVVNTKCEVCNNSLRQIFAVCPECSTEILFKGGVPSPFLCKKCEYDLSNGLVALPESDLPSKIAEKNVRCSSCSSERIFKDVESYRDLFLCFDCGKYSRMLETCEFCNTDVLDFDSEGSFFSGCGVCGGAIGCHGEDFENQS